MNTESLWAEIENEQAWRTEEIRFFQNQLANIHSEQGQKQYRRVLIVLLYAHLEGFCRFALLHYIKAVNNEDISCGNASYPIAAASLADLFHALRYPDTKCPEFRNTLPDDKKLHLFARDREFVERVDAFEARRVAIPEDVVDMESNLKPVVLRKNLYRIGLPHDQFAAVEGQIDRLLKYRNKISHGVMREGIDAKLYQELRDAVFFVMDEVKRQIMDALQNGKYMRVG